MNITLVHCRWTTKEDCRFMVNTTNSLHHWNYETLIPGSVIHYWKYELTRVNVKYIYDCAMQQKFSRNRVFAVFTDLFQHTIILPLKFCQALFTGYLRTNIYSSVVLDHSVPLSTIVSLSCSVLAIVKVRNRVGYIYIHDGQYA